MPETVLILKITYLLKGKAKLPHYYRDGNVDETLYNTAIVGITAVVPVSYCRHP